MILKLLGLMPDADPTDSGVLTACMGVVPSIRGLQGAPSAVNVPIATLAATCQGAAAMQLLDGTTRLFAGAPTKLYEAGASTWADVSRSAAYTMANTNNWRFAQFGNTTLAANGADTVQASTSSGAFSCISGAPVVSIVEVVGAFAFGANTSAASNLIQWSALNNYASWGASIATQAGSDTLTSSPGPITAVKRFGNLAVVYKKESMYLAVYVGPPNVWQVNANQLAGNAGAMSQEAVVNIGTAENPKHIFMGADNFYVYDGSKPIPIGTNRVRNSVFKRLLLSRYYACKALHDKVNTRVYFYFPTTDSVMPDSCVVYNYRTDRWGEDDRQIEAVTDYVAPGITYDGLGGYYATYNDLPNVPYDLAFLSSPQALPAVFSTSAVLQTLTGAAGNTSLTTGDIGDDILVSEVNRVRPRFLTNPTSASWTPQYRMNPGDTLSSDAPVMLSSGAFDFQRESKWHRGIMAMVGDWELNDLSLEFTEGSRE